MAVFTHLETDTGTNADISSATAVGSYTATADKLVMVDVSIDAVAGGGDYVMYVTRQINGSGSAYRILPQTTMTAASGLTAIAAQSGWITVKNGDVLTCYVDGLAGDTATPDWTTRWFEGLGAVTGVTLADDSITAAKFDESTAFPLKSADTGSTQVARVGADSDTLETLSDQLDAVKTDTAATLADTGTDGVVLKAAGLATDAVTEIQSGLALEATLTAMKGAGWSTETLKVIKDAVTNVDGDVADVFDDVGDVKTVVDTILADTNEVQAELADGGRTDLLIDGIKAKTDLIPASPAEAGEYTTTLAGLATSSEVAAIALLDEIVVGTYTVQDILKIMAAALAGKATGGGTTSVTFRGVDDNSNVIVATVDANGNRSEVVLTV